jgi:hypothetical protein
VGRVPAARPPDRSAGRHLTRARGGGVTAAGRRISWKTGGERWKRRAKKMRGPPLRATVIKFSGTPTRFFFFGNNLSTVCRSLRYGDRRSTVWTVEYPSRYIPWAVAIRPGHVHTNASRRCTCTLQVQTTGTLPFFLFCSR